MYINLCTLLNNRADEQHIFTAVGDSTAHTAIKFNDMNIPNTKPIVLGDYLMADSNAVDKYNLITLGFC